MKKDSKQKPNVPNLRFPEFQGEWEETKLQKVTQCINEKLSSSFFTNNNYISTENICQNFQGVVSATSIPINVNVTAYKKNDILISNIRPYLRKIWKATFDGGCSSDVFVFRNNKSCSSGFLYYSIANDKFINYVMSGAKGVKMPRGDKQQMFQYPIYLPSKLEQDKISTFLSLLDKRIETQMKIIEELKKLKTALVDGLYNTRTNGTLLKFSGFDKKWQKTTLGNITCNFNQRNRIKEIYPMYSVTNTQGFVNQTEKFGDREMIGEDISSYKIIHQGEFAYNPARINVGSIGRYDGNAPCMISSLYVCFRLNENIDSCWALYLLKSKRINFYYDVYGEGGVRVYLFYPNFARIKVSVPDFEEQKKIGKFISKIDERIEVETKLLCKYQYQKSYFLQQLFI